MNIAQPPATSCNMASDVEKYIVNFDHNKYVADAIAGETARSLDPFLMLTPLIG